MSNHQKRGTDDSTSSTPNPKPGQENNTATNSNNERRSNTQSLASRIQNSAAGLARNAFLPSTPAGDAAQLLSDGSKAAPSSATSALAAAERYRDTGAPTSSSSARDSTGTVPSESFRSPSSSTAQTGGFELPPLTEDEFQRSYNYGDLSEASPDTSKGKGKAVSSELNLTGNHDNTVADFQPSSFLDPTAAPVPTFLPSDGDAVITLLSDGTFDPNFANDPLETIETELQPPQLTPAEIEMIESFRRRLPADPSPHHTSAQPQRLTPLSLVPDIGSFLDTMPSQASTEATALRDTILTSLPGASDWISVEEKYHDEVWGYLQPTLEAVAKEIEAQKDTPGTTEDGPAVRRLKMILNHMHG